MAFWHRNRLHSHLKPAARIKQMLFEEHVGFFEELKNDDDGGLLYTQNILPDLEVRRNLWFKA